MLLGWAADGRRRQLVSNYYRPVAPGVVPVTRPRGTVPFARPFVRPFARPRRTVLNAPGAPRR
ncbi:hypothetical protein SHJG_2703 [Streptomyces hygroscopicus subsp. jinggangensis 5008]|nr:hypothetical protein SHJG_2703 [Streptomyces hygroscopicus subsp. jinggangensis 5008]AGF62133.1 hypothetical protein SHJGH_2467 [Streptomyces hygroscopicus subsp. jinggangensis TL01]